MGHGSDSNTNARALNLLVASRGGLGLRGKEKGSDQLQVMKGLL